VNKNEIPAGPSTATALWRGHRPSDELLQYLESEGWFFWRNEGGKLKILDPKKEAGFRYAMKRIIEEQALDSTEGKISALLCDNPEHALEHFNQSPRLSLVDYIDEWLEQQEIWYKSADRK
jgi:hypothetical protein